MNLNEYQAKTLFAENGIPIPRGRVARSAEEAAQIADELGGAAVIKALVLTGGRGKAGGIRLGKNAVEVGKIAEMMLLTDIKGFPVHSVLVDEAVNIDKEIYISIVHNRPTGRPLLITSAEGGVDIEQVAAKHPEQIIRIDINPLLGVQEFQTRQAAVGIGLPNEYWAQFEAIILGLWRTFELNDATLVEINPLVITAERKIVALDAKVVIDENALFRHQNLKDEVLPTASESEQIAKEIGINYIKLDGTIGCMVNGAGLAMATMDTIKFLGGDAANFLDIGGGAKAEKIKRAFGIIASDPNVKSILINIFGGITRCDEVAKGVIAAKKSLEQTPPIVARLIGMNSDEAKKMLANEDIKSAETLKEAAEFAIGLSKGDR